MEYPFASMQATQPRSNRDCPPQANAVPGIAPAAAPAITPSLVWAVTDGTTVGPGPVTITAGVGQPVMAAPNAAPDVPQKNSDWNQLPSGESVGL